MIQTPPVVMAHDANCLEILTFSCCEALITVCLFLTETHNSQAADTCLLPANFQSPESTEASLPCSSQLGPAVVFFDLPRL